MAGVCGQEPCRQASWWNRNVCCHVDTSTNFALFATTVELDSTSNQMGVLSAFPAWPIRVISFSKIDYVLLKMNQLVLFRQLWQTAVHLRRLSPDLLMNHLTQELLPWNWFLFRPLLWAILTAFTQTILHITGRDLCCTLSAKPWRSSSIPGCCG